MNIEQAKSLKIGDKVRCPSDRGDSSYTGTVEQVGTDEGKDYIWITVRAPSGRASIWPTSRLLGVN
jgi:hypothetical protein